MKYWRYLNAQDVEVTDEVPWWLSIFIHPQETVTGSVVYCISWQDRGTKKKRTHMMSMAITMQLMFPIAHLGSRQSRIWALQLVWRRKRRWALWGKALGWQSGGPRCTLSATTESQWGRTAYSRSRPAIFDRRRSVEKTENCWAVMETHITAGHEDHWNSKIKSSWDHRKWLI